METLAKTYPRMIPTRFQGTKPALIDNSEDTETYLTAAQAAKILNVAEMTVYQWALKGLLPSVKFGGCRRIPKNALKQWIAERSL